MHSVVSLMLFEHYYKTNLLGDSNRITGYEQRHFILKMLVLFHVEHVFLMWFGY